MCQEVRRVREVMTLKDRDDGLERRHARRDETGPSAGATPVRKSQCVRAARNTPHG